VIFLVSFFYFIIVGYPIALNLLTSSIIYLLIEQYPLLMTIQRVFAGASSFALLTVPFFVFMGQLLLKGKALEDLTEFVNSFFGHVKGALALVVVGTCLLMGSIVGLAVAEAASLGSFLIPTMKKEGYKPAFCSAIMATGSLLGPIMPPGVLMIIYAVSVGRTSIAGLFLAAMIPAFLIALAQMLVIIYRAKKENYPSYPRKKWPEKYQQLKKALPILLLPVVILGLIFANICTVTEASAIGCLYSLILTVLIKKNIKLKDFKEIFVETAATSGLIIILVGAGTVVSWIVANERIIYSLIDPLSDLPAWGFLLIVNILLLINGMLMDDAASVVIWGPIIAPIAWKLGIDPLHIGAIVCINLVIGLATPPFGIALFVTSPIAGVKIEETFKEAFPLILATIGVLALVTYIPQITLFLPRLLGY